MTHLRDQPTSALITTLILTFLISGAAHAGTISLAWDPVSHPDLQGYRVHYGTASGNYSAWSDADLSAALTLTGLQDCTNYFVAVKALGSGGLESDSYSNEISGWARPVVTSVSPVTVERGTSATLTVSGVNFQPSAQVQFDNPGISVTNVTQAGCGQLQVQITVAGSAALGVTDFDTINPDQTFGIGSGLLTVVQAVDVDPPIITAVQAGSIGSTTATVNWTTDEAADSQVFYRRAGETIYQQTAIGTSLVTSHSVSLVGLTPSTSYQFHVRSEDASGNITTSSPDQSFTTQSNGFTYIRFEAETVTPTGELEITQGAGAFGGAWINLWAGAATGDLGSPNGTWDMGFNLPSSGTWYFWYRMYAEGDCCDGWLEEVNGAGLNWLFPPVHQTWVWQDGRSYNLSTGLNTLTLGGREQLARIDRILITNDPSFIPTEAPGSDVTAPASPSGLQATPGDASVRLDWTNPSGGDLATVEVRYRTDGTYPASIADGVPAGNLPATAGAAGSLTLTGLINGTTYSFAVFVVDASGNASVPATVQAAPQDQTAPLAAVQNLRRTDTSP